MEVILWRWGAFSLYAYTAWVGAGIAVATAFVLIDGRRAGYDPRRLLDGVLWVLAGGLVGARVAYVIPNWADYATNPAALFGQWGGGLVFQGGLVAGAAALGAFALFERLPFLSTADLAAQGICLAQCLGWLGALVHGANYGMIVRSPVSLWLPDLYGVYAPRFPTQVVASLMAAALFVLLRWLNRRTPRPGSLAALYLLGNGGGHFLLEFTRADEAILHMGILRITQVGGLAQVALGAVALLYLCQCRVTLKSEA